MKIIAFGHRQGVGKSTAADYLLSNLNPGLRGLRAGFADRLKDVSYQLFYWAELKTGNFYDFPENYNLKNQIPPYFRKITARYLDRYRKQDARNLSRDLD